MKWAEARAMSLFDQPRARASDPLPSHQAAAAVEPSAAHLRLAIHAAVVSWDWRPTAFEIAECVANAFPGRWDEGTIRSAVSRAGLTVVDENGVSPRGRKCSRYTL